MKYRNICSWLVALIFLISSVVSADPEIVNIHSSNVTTDSLIKGLLPKEPELNKHSLKLRPRSIKKVYSKPKEIGVNLSLTFDFDSDQLTLKSKQILDTLGGAMNNQLAPFKFRIEGYTDGLGDAPYNMGLSARRAQAVKRYLVTKNGIASTKLFAIGKGESNLFNPTDPSAAENRRVQIINEGREN